MFLSSFSAGTSVILKLLISSLSSSSSFFLFWFSFTYYYSTETSFFFSTKLFSKVVILKILFFFVKEEDLFLWTRVWSFKLESPYKFELYLFLFVMSWSSQGLTLKRSSSKCLLYNSYLFSILLSATLDYWIPTSDILLYPILPFMPLFWFYCSLVGSISILILRELVKSRFGFLIKLGTKLTPYILEDIFDAIDFKKSIINLSVWFRGIVWISFSMTFNSSNSAFDERDIKAFNISFLYTSCFWIAHFHIRSI